MRRAQIPGESIHPLAGCRGNKIREWLLTSVVLRHRCDAGQLLDSNIALPAFFVNARAMD